MHLLPPHIPSAAPPTAPALTEPQIARASDGERLRDVFHQFVGETFYGQLLSAMRSTVSQPAYLHGGRAEETFRAQLDQVLAEKMTSATEDTFTEPMYQLFQLGRQP